jgi:hypothetical protein
VGDLADRLTILALKRLHGAAAGKDVAHFQREWAGLLTKIHGRALNGAWFEHVLDLGAVNAQLWTLTDRMRDLHADVARHAGHAELSMAILLRAADCGLAILHANDRRAELIQTINELTGDATSTEKEKL